ncbi:hypothetical protein M0805_001348 [Coniferiporia weirii]|nr:hypothetical protein M0805_001348 [Coniferiporia weirii]
MSRCSSLLVHTRSVRFACSPSPFCLPRQILRNFSGSPSSSDLPQTSVGEDTRPFKFPNVMESDVLFDSAHTTRYRRRGARHQGRVHVLNDPSYMVVDQELNEMIKEDGSVEMSEEKDASMMIDDRKGSALHKYPLVKRRVTQQTGKGKKHRMYQLVVVGNGDGLVGYGEGKHDEMSEAHNKAYIEAVRNMDAVERFEHRTIWTDMSIKLGSTRILMRPRPVGFGLHCNPNIHQVLKAAGIKDVSAKVWGSRNPINVIKATCMLIQSGNAPLSMGNGIGGKGKRLEAGVGMRSKEAVERDRGRKLVDGRTW